MRGKRSDVWAGLVLQGKVGIEEEDFERRGEEERGEEGRVGRGEGEVTKVREVEDGRRGFFECAVEAEKEEGVLELVEEGGEVRGVDLCVLLWGVEVEGTEGGVEGREGFDAFFVDEETIAFDSEVSEVFDLDQRRRKESFVRREVDRVVDESEAGQATRIKEIEEGKDGRTPRVGVEEEVDRGEDAGSEAVEVFVARFVEQPRFVAILRDGKRFFDTDDVCKTLEG
jgi:hypothetical protein